MLILLAALNSRGRLQLHWGLVLRQAILGGSGRAARGAGVLKIWAIGLQLAAGVSTLGLLALQLGSLGEAAAAATACGSIPSVPRVWTGAGSCLGRSPLALAGGVLQAQEAATFTLGFKGADASQLAVQVRLEGWQILQLGAWRPGTALTTAGTEVRCT